MGRSEQFFHGTVHDIPVHHLVVPARASGHSNYVMDSVGGKSSNHYAFATSDENTAWAFSNGDGKQRERVYRVKPHPEMQPGLYNTAHPKFDNRARLGQNLHEYVAPHFQVAERIDIKPPHSSGMPHQGTLPINWNQFVAANRQSVYEDVNHPSPHESMIDSQTAHPPVMSMRERPPQEITGQLAMPSPHDLAAEERARLNPAGFSW